MPTSFSLSVDTVDVPPRGPPLRRAHTVPCEEGLWSKATSSNEAGVSLEDSYSGLCDSNGQPYDYPAPVYVHNTFVMLMPGRDPSLDEFFKERRIHSCPPSWGPKCGDLEEEDEVPPASSRTTACSEGSGAASTPPLELSDGEDTAEVSPRGAVTAAARPRAAFMPASMPFRKTLSDYRRCDDSADADGPQEQERLPLPPGPIQNTLPPQSPEFEPAGYHVGFSDERYQAAFAGCEGSYDNGYDLGCDADYANRYVNGYDGGYGTSYDGYHPSLASYAASLGQAEFGQAEFGQTDFAMPSDPRSAGNPHMVLQLSAAIHPNSQPPPPPPGAPAPTASPLPPTPAAPMAPPADQDLAPPTRGSMNHGNGRCKPCAFVHTKGCGNGFECPFCHLCEAGEKKRRRKEKMEVRRTMRDIRQAFAFGSSGYMGRGLVS